MAKLYDLSDNSRIVKALKKGDSTAFEAVYKAYSGLLRTYQQIFYKIPMRLMKWCKMLSWLFG